MQYVGLLVVCVGLAVSGWVADSLPANWDWENSPLEWAQVVVLALGAGLHVYWARLARRGRDIVMARFWLWFAAPWVFLIGRELSWGRVLYQIGVNEAGPIFVSFSDMRYGAVAKVAIVVLPLVWLMMAVRAGVFGTLYGLIRRRSFAGWEFGLAMAGYAYSRYAAENVRYPMLEECVETWVYVGLVSVAVGIWTRVKGSDMVADRAEVGLVGQIQKD